MRPYGVRRTSSDYPPFRVNLKKIFAGKKHLPHPLQRWVRHLLSGARTERAHIRATPLRLPVTSLRLLALRMVFLQYVRFLRIFFFMHFFEVHLNRSVVTN